MEICYHRFLEKGKETTLRWGAMKQMMNRERRKFGYTRPQSLLELSKLIFKVNSLKDILKEVVVVDEDSSLIFSSTCLLQRLNKEKEVYLDGTFKVNI